MRLFFVFFIFALLQSCSFDNKSGIWKNINEKTANKEKLPKDFKKLTSKTESFNKIIPFSGKHKFNLSKPINNFKWTDIFYDQTNSLSNFQYNNINKISFRSKKLSRNNIDQSIIFENSNLISSDEKGNLLIFSINQNRIFKRFNFYKKKFKNIKKKLNIIVEDKIIYVSDNLGYLYAYNYSKDEVLWAKNYKVPFQSNLKIIKNNLIAANQNNTLYFFNKKNGDIIKFIPTEENRLKNNFINNLSADSNNLYFLNNYGSLYAVNNKSLRIRWFLNLNQSTDLTPSNLFNGKEIISNKRYVIVTTNNFTYILNKSDGSIIFKKNFAAKIKLLINKENLFLITKQNLLICMDLKNGKIIYSYNINQKIADFLNTKKKSAQFKDIMIVNSSLFIFLKNSYILKFNINGNLDEVDKLPTNIYSNPIFIEKHLLFVDTKNRISIIN